MTNFNISLDDREFEYLPASRLEILSGRIQPVLIILWGSAVKFAYRFVALIFAAIVFCGGPLANTTNQHGSRASDSVMGWDPRVGATPNQDSPNSWYTNPGSGQMRHFWAKHHVS